MTPADPADDLRLRDVVDHWGEIIPIPAAIASMGFAAGTMKYCVSGIELRDDVTTAMISETTGLPIVRHLRGHNSRRREIALIGEGCAIAITEGSRGSILVFADGEDRANELANQLASLGEKKVEEVTEGQIGLSLMYRNDRWNESVSRTIEAPTWSEIRRNYAASATSALDEVMAMTGPHPRAGGLLLLHGPSGTGKTTLLRALTREWASWCTMSYILDPGELLTSSSYLNSVVFDSRISLRGPEDTVKSPLWRLFIIEDADEILGTGENMTKGLAQLLNLTDGLLGHGINTMFAITTNAKLSTMHPALARPGRCLAEIDVPRLSISESRTWLGTEYHGTLPSEPTTLASLLDLSGTIHKISSDPPTPPRSGQYL